MEICFTVTTAGKNAQKTGWNHAVQWTPRQLTHSRTHINIGHCNNALKGQVALYEGVLHVVLGQILSWVIRQSATIQLMGLSILFFVLLLHKVFKLLVKMYTHVGFRCNNKVFRRHYFFFILLKYFKEVFFISPWRYANGMGYWERANWVCNALVCLVWIYTRINASLATLLSQL